MNRYREPDAGFDPRISEWLEADPDQAPGQLLETILEAVPSIRQRRTARLPRTSPAGTQRIYLAVGLAAVFVAGTAVALGGLVGRPAIVEPSTQPATSVAPSPQSTPWPTARLARNGLIAVTKDADLVLIDPDSGDVRMTLVDNPADAQRGDIGDLSWAPSGRRLAYAGNGGIWVVDMDDDTSRQILRCGRDANGCSIAWSPDGERIAIAMMGKLQLIDADGGNPTTLLEGKAGLTQPTWSPDGERIAFVAGDSPDERALFVIDRHGTGLKQLVAAPGGIGTWDPAWSPNGSTIAYIGSTDHRSCTGLTEAMTDCQDDWQLHVMVVELDGTAPRELLAAGTCFCIGFAPALTWAPDGTALALVIPGEGDGAYDGLVVVRADGTGQRPVGDGASGTPAWQPVP